MAVPDFQTLMLPVLREYGSGDARASVVRAAVGALLNVTPEEQAEMLPSARQTRFANRVAWAHSYLKQAQLLESPSRGRYRLTARGREVLASNPARLDIEYLTRFPEFQEFRTRAASPSNEEPDAQLPPADLATVANGAEASLTPDELIRSGIARQRAGLAAQLLERVKQASPEFFETLVIQLLVAMGYGGSEVDAGRVVGRAGDGGIDGIIKEDRLGLDTIFIQAKRWQGAVGRPEIQKFVGALQGQRAKKGVFITTSSYTADATDYASRIDTKVVLIDGKQLAGLMIDFDVGVASAATYVVKRIDSDYFEDA